MQGARRQGSETSSGIRHLRSQGSYLYKSSTHQHLAAFAAQGAVAEIPDDSVTEAFGVENWPHLLHALDEGDDVLKARVLTAMTSVFLLPQPLTMCLKLGLMELLEPLVANDKQPELQRLAAHVLSVVLEASCGRAEFQSGDAPALLVPVLTAATNLDTIHLLYDGLITFSRPFSSARVLTQHGYLPVVLVHLARDWPDALVLRALQLLRHLINDGNESTAFKALELDALQLCHRRLASSEAAVRVAACDALAALAWIDKAKKLAVEQGVVAPLCALLRDPAWPVQAASAAALTTIAIHDEGKRAVVTCGALPSLPRLLASPKSAVQLHTVKLVTVLAAFPPARRVLHGAATDFHLSSLAQDPDPLIAKCAKLAQRAVQWTP